MKVHIVPRWFYFETLFSARFMILPNRGLLFSDGSPFFKRKSMKVLNENCTMYHDNGLISFWFVKIVKFEAEYNMEALGHLFFICQSKPLVIYIHLLYGRLYGYNLKTQKNKNLDWLIEILAVFFTGIFRKILIFTYVVLLLLFVFI